MAHAAAKRVRPRRVSTSASSSSGSAKAVTLSANVAAVSPATGTPTGTITFFDGDTVIQTETLDDSGNASISVDESLAVGIHDITATYSGDDNFISRHGHHEPGDRA